MPKLSVIEALQDFRSTQPQNVKVLAAFCDASNDTVMRWSIKRHPKGKFLLRLEVFLSEQGYKLNRSLSAYEVIRYAALLVAFDVLTPRDMLQLLNVEADESYFWQVARGDINPLSVKSDRITVQELRDTYGEELEARRAKLRETISGQPPPRTGFIDPSRPPRQPTDIIAPKSEVAATDDAETKLQDTTNPLVAMTAGALLNCLPYLKALDILNHPEVGAQLRQLMGSNNFFDLLDALKGMSSREAGRYFRSTQNH